MSIDRVKVNPLYPNNLREIAIYVITMRTINSMCQCDCPMWWPYDGKIHPPSNLRSQRLCRLARQEQWQQSQQDWGAGWCRLLTPKLIRRTSARTTGCEPGISIRSYIHSFREELVGKHHQQRSIKAIDWPLLVSFSKSSLIFQRLWLVSMSYAKTNIFNWCGEVAAGRCQGPLNFPRCWRHCGGDHFCNLVQSLVQSFLDFHQSLWKCNSSDYLILLIFWLSNLITYWTSSTFSFFLNPSSEVLHLSSSKVKSENWSFNPRY